MMARRIVTARQQYALLSPWREAATPERRIGININDTHQEEQ